LAFVCLALIVPACHRPQPTTANPQSLTASAGGVPSVTLSDLVGTQSGLVTIHYMLSEVDSTTAALTVEYSTNGGTTFQAATGGPGGEGTSGLACSPSPGTNHTFIWNSVGDGVGLAAAVSTVRIRLTPRTTAAGTPASTSSFTVDNTAHTPPSVTLTTPVGIQAGLVSISYSLIDAESDPCSIVASFSVDGGTTYSAATAGPGGDGSVSLASSPAGGVGHVFLWNSVADGVGLGATATQVRIRLRPSDGQTGAFGSTTNFSVNNVGSSTGSSLGGGYPVQVNSTGTSDWATAVASDGVSLYTVGFEGFDFTTTSGADSTWRIEKRTLATGALVPLFGVGGAVSENPGPGLDVPFTVILDGAYLFVIGAQETVRGGQVFDLRVEKRRVSDGALVPTFGVGGVLTLPHIVQGMDVGIVGGLDGIPVPWTAAVDGSFLYLAGAAPTTPTDLEWRIEKRDKLTGGSITSFGKAGVIEENPTPAVDGCFGMVIDASSMWLVGGDSLDPSAASNGQIRIEKRSLLDGSPVNAFGAAGIVSVPPGPGDDLAEDVVTDGTWLYVYSRVETGLSSGLFSRRLEKRSLVDGSLGAGPVFSAGTDPSGALPFHHLALDGTSLFVIAADGSSASAWSLQKRQTSDLSLIAGFGTGGVVTINPVAGGYHRPLGVVASGGVVVVAGMASSSGDDRWRIEARWR
jgi:hypothetical protein